MFYRKHFIIDIGLNILKIDPLQIKSLVYRTQNVFMNIDNWDNIIMYEINIKKIEKSKNVPIYKVIGSQ